MREEPSLLSAHAMETCAILIPRCFAISSTLHPKKIEVSLEPVSPDPECMPFHDRLVGF
jgi:hypothetical protein